MAAGIRFEGVAKRFGGKEAVRGLTLEIAAGSRTAILGPSGCGKTTLLRMLAGLETPDAGRILVDDTVVNDPKAVVPPGRRGIGMVFQSLALWPHMTVEGNLRFARGKHGDAGREGKLLELVGLGDRAKAYPYELSGGEQQRVALARALVTEPRILLLDEPMANLDERLKGGLLDAIRRIQETFAVTLLYVTHDQEEALWIGETLAVMREGSLAQHGAPLDVYRRPASAFVAGFLGRNNLVAGTVEGGSFRCAAGAFPLASPRPPGPATAAVRAETLIVRHDGEGPLTVTACRFFGNRHLVELEGQGLTLVAETVEAVPPGTRVSVEAREPVFVLGGDGR